MELGPGELADEPLGEGTLLVADLRLGRSVDIGRVRDLIGKVEALEEEPILMSADRDRRRLAAPCKGANCDPLRLVECFDEHAVPAITVLPGAEVVRVLKVDGVDRTVRNERVDDKRRGRCLSSAFSSSGSKRTYSSFEISYPRTVSSRGTMPWMGHSRRIWIREPHFAWSRWKATPCELVAVKSWTGMTARPREI